MCFTRLIMMTIKFVLISLMFSIQSMSCFPMSSLSGNNLSVLVDNVGPSIFSEHDFQVTDEPLTSLRGVDGNMEENAHVQNDENAFDTYWQTFEDLLGIFDFLSLSEGTAKETVSELACAINLWTAMMEKRNAQFGDISVGVYSSFTDFLRKCRKDL